MITAVQSLHTFFYSYFLFESLYTKAKKETQNIEFRVVIKILTKEGANARDFHRRMADDYLAAHGWCVW